MPCNCNGGGDVDDELVDGWDDGDDWGELVDDMEARGRRRGKKARLINLFGKRRFDFSFLGNSSTSEVVLRRALPVIPFYYYMLLIRVHEIDIQNGSFTCAIYNTFPSRQDPQEFTSTSPTAMSIAINSGHSAGTLLTDTDTQESPFFKILLTVSQTTANERLYAELSAALYCRAVG